MTSLTPLPILKAGDSIEIVAPASRCSDNHLAQLVSLLTSWQLNCIVADDLFGEDLLCANHDERRWQLLKAAFQNPATQAIICARGGYGSLRLIPKLSQLIAPQQTKLFIGMSDITALHLFLEQHWHWSVLHAAIASEKFSSESLARVKAVLFTEKLALEFSALPMNSLAEQTGTLKTTITGGNLSIVQTSIGTHWQVACQEKILFLEEIGERGYRVDRMLEHLSQSGIIAQAAAIIFGDFLGGNEPNNTSLIPAVLKRFAQQCPIPVLQVVGIGHGYQNLPLPFGTPAELQLGKEPKLTCWR